MRSRLIALALVTKLASLSMATTAHADTRTAPEGWWNLVSDEMTTCLEVLPDHKLRLTFQGKMDRHPIVVDGEYTVTATKMADFHLKVAVKKIWQKQLGPCRKAWYDVDLPETKQLGRAIKVGDELRLTLHYDCVKEHPSVQLCLHDQKVVCRELSDTDKSCKPGPAIDGSKVNAPNLPH